MRHIISTKEQSLLQGVAALALNKGIGMEMIAGIRSLVLLLLLGFAATGLHADIEIDPGPGEGVVISNLDTQPEFSQPVCFSAGAGGTKGELGNCLAPSTEDDEAEFSGTLEFVRGDTRFTMDVLSFTVSAENVANIGSSSGGAGAGKLNFSELVIKTRGQADRLNPVLISLANGGSFDSVILKPDQQDGLAVEFVFNLVFLVGYDSNQAGDGSAGVDLSMAFGSMAMTTSQDDGNGGLVESVFEWSVVSNQAGNESVTGDFADIFPAESVSWGIENVAVIGSKSGGAGGGKATFKPVVAHRQLSMLTPLLFRTIAMGVQIDVVQFMHDEQDISLGPVFLEKIEWSGNDQGIGEVVSLRAGAIRISVPDSPTTPVFEWNILTNSPVFEIP